MDSTYAEVGVRVIILKGPDRNERTGWSMYMDKYIGQEASIIDIEGETGECLLDVDDGEWWWPIQDLILASDRELLRDTSVLKERDAIHIRDND